MTEAIGNLTNTERRALVVDDEETSVLILSSLLRTDGFTVYAAHGPQEMASALCNQSFDMIFLDYRLGSINGLELLGQIIQDYPKIRVIMITAHGSIQLALDALRMGASGFVSKPFEQETVRAEVRRALRRIPQHVRAEASTASETRSGIVGESPAVLRIHDQIHKMKDVDTTVLISGESGTGKELIAHALHDLSIRAAEPFEAVNCAAIPETLLEAELFGYKRGAFTDAKNDRQGLFEACGAGTLFLDEIGDLPLTLQSKLLRVLQEKVVTPLGATRPVPIQARLVAATNQNLQVLVREGRFRKDLFYRLSILQIEAPPLRERLEDVPLLVRAFIEKIAARMGKNITFPDDEIMARLELYDWPGNIRELQNAIERAIVLSDDGRLALEDLFDDRGQQPFVRNPQDLVSYIKPLSAAKEEFERKYLEGVLKTTAGNVTQASRIAGRLRTDMYRLFQKYNLNPDDYKRTR